jgi:hypothetical protein
MHDPSRYDSVAQHISRRRVLGGLGTAVATGGAAYHLSQPARAAVSIDSWTVPDASFEADAITPVVNATIAFEYDVGASDVTAVALELLVDGHTVAADELVTDATSASSQTSLSGSVLDSEAWTAADFDPAIGETVSPEVTVAVRLAILAPDDSEIVTDSAESTSAVVVAHPQQTEYVASVGGEATISDGSA